MNGDSEVDGMYRWWAALVVAAVLAGTALLMAEWPDVSAGASAIVINVSPGRNLSGGQSVTVTGRGLPKSNGANTWFVVECTTAVQGRLNPSTDTPHCDLPAAKVLHVSARGTFSAKYKVVTGIVGDGWCGTSGHLSCVLGVSDAQGQGRVASIAFKAPPAPAQSGGPASPASPS